MRVFSPVNCSRWALAGVLALVNGFAMATEGAAPAGTPAAVAVPAPSRTAARPDASPLERRVALLTRELELDATQQLKVRALLQSQREQVLRVWNDQTVPGAIRIKRTQAISQGTEDGIRALLTEEQKRRYSKPRPAGSAPGGSPAELEHWIDKMDGR